MKVELSEQLRELTPLLEGYPRKQELNHILAMPSARLPLSNTLELRDELGSRGPWGEHLLSMLHHLTKEVPVVNTRDKELAREAVEALWNGHEKLSQVAALQNTPVGIAWIPRTESEYRMHLPRIFLSMQIFLEEKLDRYDISRDEEAALRSLVAIGDKYSMKADEYIYNPFYESGHRRHGLATTAVKHWSWKMMDEFRLWKNSSLPLSTPLAIYKLANDVENMLVSRGEVHHVDDLTGIFGYFYEQRSHLTPALITTAFALSEEYNEEWALSVL